MSLELLSLTNPVFKSYTFWTGVLVIKMLAMSLLTGLQRFKTKVRATREHLSGIGTGTVPGLGSKSGVMGESEGPERLQTFAFRMHYDTTCFVFFLFYRCCCSFQTFANPEDLMSPKLKVKFDDPNVERVRRAHRNDLENIVPFFVIGLLYVLTNPSAFLAINLFRAVGIARIAHTLVYAVVVVPQPARAIAFFVALLATVYMALQVIAAAAF